jgi:hypothetical protein
MEWAAPYGVGSALWSGAAPYEKRLSANKADRRLGKGYAYAFGSLQSEANRKRKLHLNRVTISLTWSPFWH